MSLNFGAALLGAAIVAGYAGAAHAAPVLKPPATKKAPLIRHVFTTQKLISLTFDDGPSPKYTPQVLDLLKQHGAHATFFVIGKEVARFPHLIQEEVKGRHEVANHGMNHKRLKRMSEAAMKEEIDEAAVTINGAGAPRPTLYRLPAGVGSKEGYQVLGGLGYKVIGWSIDTRDYQPRSPDRIAKTVLKQAAPGAIVIFHDGGARKQNTVEALKTILPQLKEKGYRMVTVSELLKAYGKPAAPQPKAS